jgi:hypothetical protein
MEGPVEIKGDLGNKVKALENAEEALRTAVKEQEGKLEAEKVMVEEEISRKNKILETEASNERQRLLDEAAQLAAAKAKLDPAPPAESERGPAVPLEEMDAAVAQRRIPVEAPRHRQKVIEIPPVRNTEDKDGLEILEIKELPPEEDEDGLEILKEGHWGPKPQDILNEKPGETDPDDASLLAGYPDENETPEGSDLKSRFFTWAGNVWTDLNNIDIGLSGIKKTKEGKTEGKE